MAIKKDDREDQPLHQFGRHKVTPPPVPIIMREDYVLSNPAATGLVSTS